MLDIIWASKMSNKAFDEINTEDLDLTNTEFDVPYDEWELRSNRSLVKSGQKVILTKGQIAQVISYVVQGLEDPEICALTKLPRKAVASIRNDVPKTILDEAAVRSEGLMASMVEEHLRQSLAAAVNITKQVYDQDWLKQQSAGELARFYSTLTDKSIQILEASERAKEAEYQRQQFYINAAKSQIED